MASGYRNKLSDETLFSEYTDKCPDRCTVFARVYDSVNCFCKQEDKS